MKKLISIICVVFTLISCSKNEKEITIADAIYGTWELVEKIQSGNEGLPAWLPVNKFQFYTLTISEDGIITHSKYKGNGTYELLPANILRLNINSSQGNLQGEYKYVLENKNLFLSPGPNTCDVDCTEKFVKI